MAPRRALPCHDTDSASCMLQPQTPTRRHGMHYKCQNRPWLRLQYLTSILCCCSAVAACPGLRLAVFLAQQSSVASATLTQCQPRSLPHVGSSSRSSNQLHQQLAYWLRSCMQLPLPTPSPIFRAAVLRMWLSPQHCWQHTRHQGPSAGPLNIQQPPQAGWWTAPHHRHQPSTPASTNKLL
jgi:hypothetical protein